MRFKEFIQKEEQGGGDQGLLGGNPDPMTRKPSDGQPFSKWLSDFQPPSSAAGPPGMGGGMGGSPAMMMMMRKGMKKGMKKKMKKD